MGSKWPRRSDAAPAAVAGDAAPRLTPVVGAFAAAVVERAVVARDDSGDTAHAVQAADAAVERARQALHASLAVPSPFSALVAAAALTADEAEVLAVLVGCEVDERLQKLLVHLTADGQRARVELGLLDDLFAPPHPAALAVAGGGGLRRAALVAVRAAGPWSRHAVEVSATVVQALRGDTHPDPALPYGARMIEVPTTPMVSDAALVVGPDAVRRREVAGARIGGGRMLVSRLPAADEQWEALVREATLTRAALVLEVDGEVPEVGRRWIDLARHLRVVISTKRPIPTEMMPVRAMAELEADAAPPTDEEWSAALGDVPRSHRLTPEQLEQAVVRLPANGGDLDRTVRHLVSARLDELTQRVRPSRGWHELVLPDDQVALLADMVRRYQNAGVVFDQWGFPASPSRGLVLLFSGPSGTGKTLAAEVMAGALGLDLYRLDLSSVVSKYIGETEKNLDEVFNAAGAGNLVLFFDEADSLFGKRSEVRDAHDRYANLEVSYLLQRLERYDGVVVLATNFEKNLDDAFVRRIHARIDFAVPSEAQRREIWVQHLPQSAPLALDVDADLDALAHRFEMTGGSIRNAAVAGAFFAAQAEQPIGLTHLLMGVERELRKQGRLIRRDEFPELFR